jgi:hypothetical protein
MKHFKCQMEHLKYQMEHFEYAKHCFRLEKGSPPRSFSVAGRVLHYRTAYLIAGLSIVA